MTIDEKLDRLIWYWQVGMVVITAMLALDFVKTLLSIVMYKRHTGMARIINETFDYTAKLLKLARSYLEMGNDEKNESRQKLQNEIGRTVTQAVHDAAPAVAEKIAEVIPTAAPPSSEVILTGTLKANPDPDLPGNSGVIRTK